MAEKFNSYLTTASLSTGNTEVELIPNNGVRLPTDTNPKGLGTRAAGATCQVHSIYLTKSSQESQSDNPENDGVPLSIYIIDNTDNNRRKYYLAKYINVLPNSSFYIEKTITLRPQDSLFLKYEGNSVDTVNVDAICSSVDLTNA